MRLVRVPDPLDARTFAASLPSGGVYHSQPDHPSFAALSEVCNIRPLDPEAVGKDDTVLLLESGVSRLRVIVELLLSPHGCPWDREQTHLSLRASLIEETYEAIYAIESGDDVALREELGDLLLQPILHAAIAERRGAFNLDGVATAIADKLERRHPHVFGETTAEDTAAVLQNWDAIKRAEGRRSILAGVPRSMPALSRAMQISKRAARAGFEWPDREGVFAKIEEELLELREAAATGDPEAIESELGDLLFTLVNYARWSDLDAEEALRKMLDRFQGRFTRMEMEDETPLRELTPDEWESRWQRAKRAET